MPAVVEHFLYMFVVCHVVTDDRESVVDSWGRSEEGDRPLPDGAPSQTARKTCYQTQFWASNHTKMNSKPTPGPTGERTALFYTVGRGLAAPPQEINPRFGPSALKLRPFGLRRPLALPHS